MIYWPKVIAAVLVISLMVTVVAIVLVAVFCKLFSLSCM